MESPSPGANGNLNDDGFINWDHEQRKSSLVRLPRGSDDERDQGEINVLNKFSEETVHNKYEDEGGEDNDEEDETWSVRVRLISAVDLPTCLSPSTPLCPLFKIGLITLNDEQDVDALVESQMSSCYEFGNTTDVKKNAPTKNSSTSQSNNPTIETFLRSNNPLTSLHSSYDEIARIKRCADKISSSRDNGMMEWHEDLRWNDVALPLQTVVAVELIATSMLPSTSMKKSDFYFSQPNSAANKADDMNYDEKDIREDDLSTSGSTTGSGILNLWRKGRHSIEQRRRRGGTSPKYPSRSLPLSSKIIDNLDESKKELYMDEYVISTNEKSSISSVTKIAGDDGLLLNITEMNNSGIVSEDEGTSKQRIDESYSETDMRLGALVFPLSQLPLGEDQPRLEKWFQLDTPSSIISGKSDILASSNDDKKMLSPRRSPSVLLEITLCSEDDLNAIEDQATANNSVNARDEDDKTTHENVHICEDTSHLENSPHQTKRGSGRKRTLSSHKKSSSGATKLHDAESIKVEQQKQQEQERIEKIRQNGPFLETGIVDYIAVVGPNNIGNQKDDDGSRGWVKSSPSYGVLEQFPPNNDLHSRNGRHCTLPQGIEWWCFPEGCKIWRGADAPTHLDMNLKRFTASSPPTLTSSIAAFDACLNCTTSFLWWVINSKSDEYGSQSVKTYGAVIRFYVPAPVGCDRTQDNYAQSNLLNERRCSKKGKEAASTISHGEKRIWCPLAICLTSSLPIIGILEALLLRLCEKLASKVHSDNIDLVTSLIYSDIVNLIANFQSPIPGVLNCSIPFLTGDGDRLLVSLPPVVGLPALPHGSAVTSVCRLLGPEGLTALLAAILTECKVLIHSDDVANLAMVAEVVTSLIYPFVWQLPYIPVLPVGLFEIIEAPLAFILGIPSCNLQYIDKSVLSDIVVIDLDNGFSSPDYFDGRRSARSTKAPTSLPASISSNISKAVFRLLREEEEVEEHFGASNYSGIRHLPKLEGESLAEREFRITVSQQICGLVRGYQDCLFFVSASQPVFNRDRFLRHAPALYEDRKGNLPLGHSSINFSLEGARSDSSQERILSPRSKRFLSAFVNTQLFHALLERLDSEETAFFHEIMDTFEFQDENKYGDTISSSVYGSSQQEKAIRNLSDVLESIEQKIPTYHIRRKNSSFDYDEELILGGDDDETIDFHDSYTSFTNDILQSTTTKASIPDVKASGHNGVHRVSLDKLVELDEKPWHYNKLFEINLDTRDHSQADNFNLKLWSQIQLRDALGERKFRSWKSEQQKRKGSIIDDNANDPDRETIHKSTSALDLPAIISSASTSEKSLDIDPRNARGRSDSLLGNTFTKEMDAVRICLVNAYQFSQNESSETSSTNLDEYDSILLEARNAMGNAAAQRYLMSILNQPTRLKIQGKRRQGHPAEDGIRLRPRQNSEVAFLRLQAQVFECFISLCSSMLDACSKDQDFETAYRLLTHTTGFCIIISRDTAKQASDVLYMTKRISIHAIFADLRLWEKVSSIHKKDRRRDRNTGNMPSVEYRIAVESRQADENDEYEAAVSTMYEMLGYGIAANILMEFATKVCGEKFYSTEKEDQILLLARRLVLKCDDVANAERYMSLLLHERSKYNCKQIDFSTDSSVGDEETERNWQEIEWAHPSAMCTIKDDSFSSLEYSGNGNVQSNVPITALTSFGSSVVATGSLDGSVFITHTFRSGGESAVKGIRLEANKMKNMLSTEADSEIGAVNCLVATKGFNEDQDTIMCDDASQNVDAILSATSNCRVIAGTTTGNIKVWLISEIFARMYESRQYVDNDLKGELQGVDLTGHRGGVTCLDVPSNLYRLDSIVSGGNDGLIKIWSLRDSVQNYDGSVGHTSSKSTHASRLLFTGRDNAISGTKPIPDKKPRDTLTGHGGRLTCIKSTWYGDRLVSGGEDRTLKLWDLTSSGGRCLQTMKGHSGWITKVDYWGRNTIISSSTDRSIGLWDIRTGDSPLAFLSYHTSPVSDLFIGSRSSFQMVSAGADGAVATWDFRKLSEEIDRSLSQKQIPSQTFRTPGVEMNHCREGSSGIIESGPVMLSRGSMTGFSSVMSVSVDGKMKDWDIVSGKLIDEHTAKHSGAVSCFLSFLECDDLPCPDTVRDVKDKYIGGTITTSWDGTVLLRKLRRYL